MNSLRQLEGFPVVDARGRRLGVIAHMLCHPKEPRVVGFEMRPPNVAYFISRAPRFVALEGARIVDDRLEVDDLGRWSNRRAERTLGFKWDDTVIWPGMPMGTAVGDTTGFVRDATFEFDGGAIRRILVTDGLGSDIAVGTREVDGDDVEHFDGKTIIVTDRAATAEFSGGVAKTAGTGVATAKVVAGDAARRATQLGGDLVKAASKSKTARSAWAVLRETGKAFKDGLKGNGE